MHVAELNILMDGYAHAHILLHTLRKQCYGIRKKKRMSDIGADNILTQYVVSNLDCAGMDLRVGKAWTETRHKEGGAREVGTRT